MRSGWIYLMVHIPFVFWVKIGITGKTAGARAKEIDRAMFGFPFPIMAIYLPGVNRIEKAFHRLCSPLSVRFYKGDGHTEWFWLIAGLPVFGIGCLYWWGIYEIARLFF